MPIVENKIDTFDFITIEGNPEAIKSRLAVFARAGVPGVQICDEAQRGEPFQVVTKVDCEDFASARLLYLLYCDLIGSSAVGMTWNGWDLFIENGTSVVVLNVEQLACRALAAASGGLNPPSRAWLVCRWTLIPIN